MKIIVNGAQYEKRGKWWWQTWTDATCELRIEGHMTDMLNRLSLAEKVVEAARIAHQAGKNVCDGASADAAIAASHAFDAALAAYDKESQ